MRTVTKKLYEFKELSKEKQEKAIENYRDNNQENLYDEVDGRMLRESMFIELEEEGIITEDKSIYWSCSYCQGDGLVILGTIYNDDIKSILKECDDSELIELNEFLEITGKIKHNSMYFHTGTMDFDFDSNLYYLDEEETIDFIVNTLEYPRDEVESLTFNGIEKTYIIDGLERIKDIIKGYFINKAKQFEKAVYKDVEYHYSKDYIYDCLYDNDSIEFLEDGTRYR